MLDDLEEVAVEPTDRKRLAVHILRAAQAKIKLKAITEYNTESHACK